MTEVNMDFDLKLTLMKTDLSWRLTKNHEQLRSIFGSLDSVFALKKNPNNSIDLSDLVIIEHEGIKYYVKRYYSAGKGLRRLLGRSRLEGEWLNLAWFAENSIPTAEIVGYGLEQSFGVFKRGALITKEVPNSVDLAEIAFKYDPRLKDKKWVREISSQVAHILKTLHQRRFIHNDFKWRNILVDSRNKVYLIDCPLGDFWSGWLLRYRIEKEFSTLDSVAKYRLSRTQRLKFYLQYAEKQKLEDSDKKFILRVLKKKLRRESKFK